MKWNKTIASAALAFLLASCGPAEIIGKWETSRHVAWVFAEKGDCYSFPKGRSATWCRWKGRSDGNYDIDLSDDIASSHVVGHIRGGNLEFRADSRSSRPIIVLHRLSR